MTVLQKQSCVPCTKKSPPLPADEQAALLQDLNGWQIEEGKRLVKTYLFRDYAEGLGWINELSEIAEVENHHPDVFLSWGKVRLEISTHAIGALHRNDFILAAKLDLLERRNKE